MFAAAVAQIVKDHKTLAPAEWIPKCMCVLKLTHDRDNNVIAIPPFGTKDLTNLWDRGFKANGPLLALTFCTIHWHHITLYIMGPFIRGHTMASSATIKWALKILFGSINIITGSFSVLP